MFSALKEQWLKIPQTPRKGISFSLKLMITVLAFYLLLTHPISIEMEDGGTQKLAIYDAIAQFLPSIDSSTFWKFCAIAGLIKLVGVGFSAWGWHLLLKGQGIVFPFWRHIMTTFLIGRFIGTFLPSTVGLDAYTLYDASKYSRQWERATTAKVLEKFIGVTGLFLSALILLPFGVSVFKENAVAAGSIVGVFAGSVVFAVFLGVFRPKIFQAVLRMILGFTPGFIKSRIENHANRFIDAVGAYENQAKLLSCVFFAKFITHFNTAVVYVFTALAVGVSVNYAMTGQILFASTIQIFGTLLSPTIAGEGAREAIQAMLLGEKMGTVQSVLSAALGFIAAEAATLWGGVFWWGRKGNFKPAYCLVDGEQVEYDEDDEDDASSMRSSDKLSPA